MARSTGLTIAGSYVATGTGTDYLPVRGCKQRELNRGTLWLTGTWVGTVQLMGSAPDANAFAPVSNQSFTAPISITVNCAADEDLRVDCTAFTSGTINYQLTFTG